ncbi:unnamed protein product [Allacma fusca]|uniref:Uncharacterized protein n=1 Tax=Allacma fusca TaxID=39272 RepID=A0A8J2KNN2_9HEXA|nr:unnamed protein product [Allacma fusca]
MHQVRDRNWSQLSWKSDPIVLFVPSLKTLSVDVIAGDRASMFLQGPSPFRPINVHARLAVHLAIIHPGSIWLTILPSTMTRVFKNLYYNKLNGDPGRWYTKISSVE